MAQAAPSQHLMHFLYSVASRSSASFSVASCLAKPNRAIVHALEVGAVGRQQLEAGLRQAVAEQVTLSLIERWQFEIGRRVFHESGQAMLHRRVDGKDIELVDLAELVHQRRWRGNIADLPAGDMVGLAEAG